MHASPYDNAVAFAASAGAVPATPAGSGDGAVLGARRREYDIVAWQRQCHSGQGIEPGIPGGSCGAAAAGEFQGGYGGAIAVSVVGYAAAAQQCQRAGLTAI